MKKWIALGVVLLALGGVGFYFYQESQQQMTVRNTLSNRSKAYIEKKSKEGEGRWRYSNVGQKGGEAPRNLTETIDGCFSFTMPFQVKMARPDNASECSYYYQLADPKGSVTIYQRTEAITSADEMPGVSMRRQSSHTYEEQVVKAGGKTFLVFKNKSAGGYEVNAFYYGGGGKYLIATLQAYTGDDLDEELQALLGSIKFL